MKMNKITHTKAGFASKPKHRVLALLIAFCSLLFVFGCNDFNLRQGEQPQLPEGYGSLTLKINGTDSQARAILPDNDVFQASIKKYFIEIEDAEDWTVYYRYFVNVGEIADFTTELPAGDYWLYIAALNDETIANVGEFDDREDEIVVAEYEEEINIPEGQNKEFQIDLKPSQYSWYNGTFSWNITLPTETLEESYITITPQDNSTLTAFKQMFANAESLTEYFEGGGGTTINTTDTIDLPAGNYDVAFTFIRDDGSRPVVWNETLHIYTNLTSEFEKDFSDFIFGLKGYFVRLDYNGDADNTGILEDHLFHGQKLGDHFTNIEPASNNDELVFDGWFDLNTSVKWTVDTPVDRDLDLIAWWTVKGLIYTITGGDGSFTATLNDENKTAIVTDSPIQTVINTINTHANEEDLIIQFGDNGETLNIGSGGGFSFPSGLISFTNSDGNWGEITLRGNLEGSFSAASSGNNPTNGMIVIEGPSIISTANIYNTGASDSFASVFFTKGTGTLTISDGEISVVSSQASSRAIHHESTGELVITGGTISATAGNAIHNFSTGKITISGENTIVTSANNATSGNYIGTIQFRPHTENIVVLEINGGLIENTANRTIENASNGSIIINDGIISSNSDQAIYNSGAGTITINDGIITLTSGTTIWNTSTGNIIITGGEIISERSGRAIYTAGASTVTISGENTIISSAATSATWGTIRINSLNGILNIHSGTIRNIHETNVNARAITSNAGSTINIYGGNITSLAGTAAIEGPTTVNISGSPVIDPPWQP